MPDTYCERGQNLINQASFLTADKVTVRNLIIEEAEQEISWLAGKVGGSRSQLLNLYLQLDWTSALKGSDLGHEILDHLMKLRSKDSYTYRHSLGVAALSYWIGSKLGWSHNETRDLAVSGLLHDFGKLYIPDSILKKPGKLNLEEFHVIRNHTHYGYEIVRNLPGVTEPLAKVILEHHEREDGSGYPYGLTGDKIAPFSKVVAVADVFHTMISERVYKKPLPIFKVLEELLIYSCHLFDPKVIQCFGIHIMKGLVGQIVYLSNGQTAKILMIHPNDLLNPIVKVKGQHVDLRKSPDKLLSLWDWDPL